MNVDYTGIVLLGVKKEKKKKGSYKCYQSKDILNLTQL